MKNKEVDSSRLDACGWNSFKTELFFKDEGRKNRDIGDDILRIINKYSDAQNITFTGKLPREEVYALLHKFDICTLPYDKDDKHSLYPDYFSSRKAKEYIAAGKPIIVSDVVGRESWLIENQNCLLYEPGNPKDLAEKIEILLNNEELYDKICTNNTNLSKNFTWDAIIDRSGIIDDIRG